MQKEDKPIELEEPIIIPEATQLEDVEVKYHKHWERDIIDNTVVTVPVIFSGSVSGNGNSVNLPTGWTVAHNSDGDYTVTHNLGYATYNLVLTTNGDYGMIKINGKGNTTFGVRNLDPGGAFLLDTAFDFILIKY